MFIGMMIGMLLRDTKLVEWRLPFFKQVIAMSFAIGNLLCAIYMQYSWNRSGHEGPQSPAGNAAYQTFGRMYFVCSIACIVVLGITKNGGIVYEILSAGFWEVFGKLTFGAYLVRDKLTPPTSVFFGYGIRGTPSASSRFDSKLPLQLCADVRTFQ